MFHDTCIFGRLVKENHYWLEEIISFQLSMDFETLTYILLLNEETEKGFIYVLYSLVVWEEGIQFSILCAFVYKLTSIVFFKLIKVHDKFSVFILILEIFMKSSKTYHDLNWKSLKFCKQITLAILTVHIFILTMSPTGIYSQVKKL